MQLRGITPLQADGCLLSNRHDERLISVAGFGRGDLPQLLTERGVVHQPFQATFHLLHLLRIALTVGVQFTDPARQFLQLLGHIRQLLFDIRLAALQQLG